MAVRGDPTKKFRELKDAAAKARLPFDVDVWLNLAFYLNEQYTEWVSESAMIRRIPRGERQENSPRPVVNKIMHFVAQSHASALQDKPTVDVLPASDSYLDIGDSQVARAYARYIAEPQVGNLDEAVSDAVMWAIVGGEGYLKWIWNPRLKRPDVMSCSPLDIYVDPYVRHFSKARYIIHSQFMDVEQVYNMFGTEVKPSTAQRVDELRVALLREMGQSPVLQGVIVNEIWMLPNRRHPNGLFAVWSDSNKEFLVEPTKFPYQHKRLPFTQIGMIPRPGSQHFMSAVKFLRSPQMELNKYRAQRIAIREAFANPKWFIPGDLELNEMPNDSPRQVLISNGPADAAPQILVPTGAPDNRDGDWIVDEMMNVVGLHEVSQAQVPGRVEAARAIELLKESDVNRLKGLRDTLTAALSEGTWQLLMLAQQYEREEIIVQVYSREGVPEVQRFKSETWKPGMRVVTTMGSGLARSRAARQQQTIELWREGILRDPELVSELLEIPMPTLIPHKAEDIRLARNENHELAKNTAIEPNSWDEHGIHIREHNKYRKTAEYVGLDSDAKKKFEHHVTRHEALQIEQLQKDVQLAQLAQGTQPGAAPGGAGTGESPDARSPDTAGESAVQDTQAEPTA